MISVAFGIPGVGKSTVIKEVTSKTSFERIYWGEIVFKLALERNYVEDIDMVRKLSIDDQKKLQRDVCEHILETVQNSDKDHFIIETHAAVKTPQGFMPGFTPALLQKLDPMLFIVIEADASNIYSRRNSDETRDRKDDLSVEDIQKHLDVTRYFAAGFATQIGSELSIVRNREGHVEEAVDTIVKLLSGYVD